MNFRRAWKFCGWCTLQGSRVFLWSVWALLLVSIAGQIHLISSRRVPVPEPLRRFVVRELADRGIRFDYARARMDLAGRLLMEDVRLGGTDEQAPQATAHTAFLHLNPWLLTLGVFELREVRIDGMDVHLPGNETDAPVHDVDFALELPPGKIRLSYAKGYIGTMPFVANGDLKLAAHPDSADTPWQSFKLSPEENRRIRDTVNQSLAWLEAVAAPELHIAFTTDTVGATRATIDLSAASVDLTALHAPVAGRLEGLLARAETEFGGRSPAGLQIKGSLDSVQLSDGVSARGLVFQIDGTPSLSATGQSVRLQASRVSKSGITTGPVAVSINRDTTESLSTDLSVLLAGSPWRLQAHTAPAAGTAHLHLDGFVDDAMLSFVGGLIGKDLTELLDPAQAAPLHAEADFGPGWKLREAAGRLHSGFVRVGTVNLDETGTEFTYDGNRVLCDSLVLRQGDSLALGSYSMDTHTMDFRFLLTGSLRPMGISGWFHAWWTNFWDMFDFTQAAPEADVDVQGRWGDLTATNVFVTADGNGTGIKGVPFDRVRTRLFLRPHWFDIQHFEVDHGDRQASGRLARSFDHTGTDWLHMDFAVESGLPLETITALFKTESAQLLAPYRFTRPPQLTLGGHVESAAAPSGAHQTIDIDLTSSGPMTYHGFPLSDLVVKARMRDDDIEIPELSVLFANGRASGHARLWNPEPERHLAFDIQLTDAHLGAAIDAVSTLQSPSPAPPSAQAEEEARLRIERLEKNRLALTLMATGKLADFLSFQGNGHASITGTNLGQLNLFGPLSQAMRGTFINLGSFSLNTVDAPFQLITDRLHFDNLRVSGPSALIQAKGDYQLKAGRLDFTAKVRPFDASDSLVGSAVSFVLSPLSAVFEVKLKGTLSEPSWIFNYGPSRLLNSITGEDKPVPSSNPATPGS
jgi:hypothetical protein